MLKLFKLVIVPFLIFTGLLSIGELYKNNRISSYELKILLIGLGVVSTTAIDSFWRKMGEDRITKSINFYQEIELIKLDIETTRYNKIADTLATLKEKEEPAILNIFIESVRLAEYERNKDSAQLYLEVIKLERTDNIVDHKLNVLDVDEEFAKLEPSLPSSDKDNISPVDKELEKLRRQLRIDSE